MKKFFVFMMLMCCAVCLGAPNFWNVETDEDVAAVKAADVKKIQLIKTLNNANYKTYAELKAACKGDTLTCQMVIFSDKYKKFIADAATDETINSRDKFLFAVSFKYDLRKTFQLGIENVDYVVKFKNKTLEKRYKSLIESILTSDLKDEEKKQMLKQLKLRLYPSIGENETVKQICTYIELAMKALE